MDFAVILQHSVKRAVKAVIMSYSESPKLFYQAPLLVFTHQAHFAVARGIAAFHRFEQGVLRHIGGEDFGLGFVFGKNHIHGQCGVGGVVKLQICCLPRLHTCLFQRRPAVAGGADAAVGIAVAAKCGFRRRSTSAKRGGGDEGGEGGFLFRRRCLSVLTNQENAYGCRRPLSAFRQWLHRFRKR